MTATQKYEKTMLTDEKFLQTRLSGDVKNTQRRSCLNWVACWPVRLLITRLSRRPFRKRLFRSSVHRAQSRGCGEVDLSLFQNNDQAQLPGDYDTALYVNKKLKLRRSISYLSREDGTLEPQITPDILRALGVNVDAFPALKIISLIPRWVSLRNISLLPTSNLISSSCSLTSAFRRLRSSIMLRIILTRQNGMMANPPSSQITPIPAANVATAMAATTPVST